MKFIAGIAAGVVVTVLGQWILQSTPDFTSAGAQAGQAWSWAQDFTSNRLWLLVIAISALALVAFACSALAIRQGDWFTEHVGYTIGLAGCALALTVAAVVATAAARADRAATAALMILGLTIWVVRRLLVARRVMRA